MKIGIESAAYLDRYGIGEGFARMRRHGYECVDFSLADTETDYYDLPETEADKEIALLVREAEKNGIAFSQTHGPWRFPPRDGTPEERAERFEKMAKCLTVTRKLGAPCMAIHPLMPFGPSSETAEEAEKAWGINREFYLRLAEIAERERVIVCLENMPMHHLASSEPPAIRRFAEEIGSEYFRCCLDTGHVAVFGKSPADAVQVFGKDYLKIMHVHDNDGTHDQHRLPGEGVVDFAAYVRALEEIGFCGAFSFETRVPIREGERNVREEDEIALCRLAYRLVGRKYPTE